MKVLTNGIVCQVARMGHIHPFLASTTVCACQVRVTLWPANTNCVRYSLRANAAVLANGIVRLVAGLCFVLIGTADGAIRAREVSVFIRTASTASILFSNFTAAAGLTAYIL